MESHPRGTMRDLEFSGHIHERKPRDLRENDHVTILIVELFHRCLHALEFLAHLGVPARGRDSRVRVHEVSLGPGTVRVAGYVPPLRQEVVTSRREFSKRRGKEPSTKSSFCGVLKGLSVRENLAAHGLDDVRVRFMPLQEGPRSQANEGPEVRQHSPEQFVDRSTIPRRRRNGQRVKLVFVCVVDRLTHTRSEHPDREGDRRTSTSFFVMRSDTHGSPAISLL